MSDHFTTPATAYPVPAPPAWPAPTAGGGMSTGVKVLVAIAAAVGGFIVLGILAAIAIPVLLKQRADQGIASRSVALPAEVLGFGRLTDPRFVHAAEVMRSSMPGNAQVAVYGTGSSPRTAVSVSSMHMTDANTRAFVRGMARGGMSNGLGVLTFSDVDPGSLGGVMQCTTVTKAPVTICVFGDTGALGAVMLYGPLVGHPESAVSVREAVEHRR